MQINKLHPSLGAEVRGVDLSQALNPTDVEDLRAAWEDNAVLVFPDQPITDAQHVAFSRNFGELEIFPQGDNRADSLPEIFRVANTDENGRILPVDDPTARFITLTWFWHTDSCYRPIPSRGAILHGIEVPDEGGDTLFANMFDAYASLPGERKAALSGMRARHSFEYLRSLRGLPPMRPEEAAKVPPVEHPLVRTHRDGRSSLYISPPYMESIDGLGREETDALVEELIELTTTAEFVYRHRWSAHDILMWDNRSTMHIVTPYDCANERRIMHRTAIAGTEAVA